MFTVWYTNWFWCQWQIFLLMKHWSSLISQERWWLRTFMKRKASLEPEFGLSIAKWRTLICRYTVTHSKAINTQFLVLETMINDLKHDNKHFCQQLLLNPPQQTFKAQSYASCRATCYFKQPTLAPPTLAPPTLAPPTSLSICRSAGS